ncbi:MAG: STAS domain-containing protein [Desulfuromonas sp.]|nr:STAS domain-containing protein [Desulfuromonas sp.]
MKIELEQRGTCTLLKVQGRLDATWADFFADTLMGQIRQGQHWLVADAAELVFLSSAGIRAMMQVYKELNKVSGQFGVVNAQAFVKQTLLSSGLGMWMEVDVSTIPPLSASAEGSCEQEQVAYYALESSAPVTAAVPALWRPWQQIDAGQLMPLRFEPNSVALGIGAPQPPGEDAGTTLGEFLAVAGNVVFQPPQEQSPADYLVAEERFIPQLQCAQALEFRGAMAHLLRFAPSASNPEYSMSQLLHLMRARCDAAALVFVILGEIEGLVGATLVQSPIMLAADQAIEYPQIRDWLSFCGERSHSGKQALIVGVATKQPTALVPPLPSAAQNDTGFAAAHMHATVFARQPLQNGKIAMQDALVPFFSGSPPLTVMHLLDDRRQVLGLGESALIRGACWFGEIQNPEVLA